MRSNLLLILLVFSSTVTLAPSASAATCDSTLGPFGMCGVDAAPKFSTCQTRFAGVNCITPDGWYCWVYVDAFVEKICYRPL